MRQHPTEQYTRHIMIETIKLTELTKRRRASDDEDSSEIDISSTDSNSDEEERDQEEIVNIDFDFFGGNPAVDFHAIKNLLRQLLGNEESNKVQLSQLSDLILNSPTTTIKTDGTESDPYCFLSFVDYKEHCNSNYARYLKKDERMATFLRTVEANAKKSCALVLSERLINMPAEVVPPLYKITLEDVTSALGNGNNYDFYVILSRKYEVNFDTDSDSDDEGERSKKRVKQEEVDYFHAEDRYFEKNSKLHYDLQPKKGLIPTYIVISHQDLLKSISELEHEIETW
ncbi:BCP1 (YDR361C) [Zygosaccharomyces parabailii]|nr:BCP1 (YDR361C) [Zygosaccharomyces parabailii]